MHNEFVKSGLKITSSNKQTNLGLSVEFIFLLVLDLKWEGVIASVLVLLPVAVMKYHDNSNLREKGFIRLTISREDQGNRNWKQL